MENSKLEHNPNFTLQKNHEENSWNFVDIQIK